MSTDASPVVRRGYVDVSFGQVHYRSAGFGPPVVLLHDSPRSSAMHEALLASLADEFTAIALDTPGFGHSSPLPAAPRPEIPDYADALAETLAALGLPACCVYGFHTSSKIALELAVRHPARVSALILDGLSLPAAPPDEAFLASYLTPFVAGDDGGYLVAQWTRLRDGHRFFPWFRREPSARLAIELPDERALHGYALDVYTAGANYVGAYAAALRYAARPALARLATPTVFMARADDVLYRYLDELPATLPDDSRIERLPADREAWESRLRLLLRERADGAPFAIRAADPLSMPASVGARAGYVEHAGGQLAVWRHGAGIRAPVIVLPDAPASAASLAEFAAALANERAVYTLDWPGIGESDALGTPDAAGYAEALRAVIAHAGPEPVDLIAEGLATSLAIELARQMPDRIRRVVLDAPLLLSAGERRELWRSYCPKLAPRGDGAHLVTLWQRFRDTELAWPWFDRRPDAIRARTARLDGAYLHAQLLGALRQLDRYGDAANAAIEYPVKERLPEVHQRVLLPVADGDPRYRGVDKVRRRLPAARTIARAEDPQARAAACLAFFDAP